MPRSLLEPPTGDTLGYRPETIQPRGPLELYAGDTVQVSVVAAPDMEIRARLGDASVRLVPELPDVSNAGRLVFDFSVLEVLDERMSSLRLVAYVPAPGTGTREKVEKLLDAPEALLAAELESV